MMVQDKDDLKSILDNSILDGIKEYQDTLQIILELNQDIIETISNQNNTRRIKIMWGKIIEINFFRKYNSFSFKLKEILIYVSVAHTHDFQNHSLLHGTYLKQKK